MALQFENQIEIIEIMESFLIKIRPSEEIKSKLDINYKVEDQSVILFEIRPDWKNSQEKREYNIAKATFVKKENQWKIFSFMSDLKWQSYKPKEKVNNLKEFVKIVEEDKLGSFWG